MTAARDGSESAARAIRAAAKATIVLSLAIGALTRPLSILHYIDFRYDQAIQGQVITGMWHGVWPRFGPQPLHQPFEIPPLHYYLVFPASAFGPNPVFQVLPNAILSLCSVAALMYLVYLLLDSVTPARRLLLTGIAGLWWSVSNVDIQLANREWNPSFVPFFVICCTILFALLATRPLTAVQSTLTSIAYGVAAAILTSVHGSTLFVTPTAFLASLMYLGVAQRRNSKNWLYPAVAAAAFLLILAPYLHNEAVNHFDNTRAMVAVVSSHVYTTLSTRVDNARGAYFGLRESMYFPSFGFRSFVLSHAAITQALRVVGLLFLVVVPFVGIGYFKGNRVILAGLGVYWLLFLFAASSYPTPYIHYKLPIVLAPLILSVASLAYINYSSVFGKLAAAFIAVCLLVSIIVNGVDDVGYLQAKFGDHRLMTTNEAAEALASLPERATICGPEREARIHALGYIDAFITKRQLRFSHQCQPGDYAVYSRYIFEKAPPLAPDINDDLATVLQPVNPKETVISETPAYTIGRLK